MLDVALRATGDVTVVDLDGEFDTDSLKIIEDFTEKDGAHSKENVVLNLKSVSSITSSGIGILLDTFKAFRSQGRIAKLTNANPRLLEIFRMHKVLPAFDIIPDEDSAVKMINAEMAEKEKDYIRLFERVNIELKTKFRKFMKADSDGPYKVGSGTSKCLSMYGLFINTKTVFPMDTLLEVHLFLPDGFFKTQVKFISKVVRVADKDESPELYPGMGTNTLFMERRERAKLEKFIAVHSSK